MADFPSRDKTFEVLLRDLVRRVERLELVSEVPTGAAVWFPSTPDRIPSGWLPAGARVSRARYRGLFDFYGTEHGAGDGLTTFDLPTYDPLGPVGLWIVRA